MGDARWTNLWQAACGATLALVLVSGVAQAKPWARWAPNPLASDSSFAAFSARPADSLNAGERAWLEVQHDWREQRSLEAQTPGSITSTWRTHPSRRTDTRFAALASRPYTGLSDSERAWLIGENAAQRAAREATLDAGASHVLGTVVLASILGAVAGYFIIAYGVTHGRLL